MPEFTITTRAGVDLRVTTAAAEMQRRSSDAVIDEMYLLNKSVWEEFEGELHRHEFEVSLGTFAEGCIMAYSGETLVGSNQTEIIDYPGDLLDDPSWEELSDGARLAATHRPEGNALYDVAFTVGPAWQSKGIGKVLLKASLLLCEELDLEWLLAGARCPGYRERAGEMSIADYLALNVDPHVERFKSVGLRVIRPLPDYYPDPESLDWGVLVGVHTTEVAAGSGPLGMHDFTDARSEHESAERA